MERRLEADGTGISAALDPLTLARKLDSGAAVARPRPAGPPSGHAPDSAGRLLVVPVGVRPDGPEAIDWLLALDEPVTVLVDGYNVSYLLEGADFSTPKARDRLNQGLSVLARRGGRRVRVCVVYDSSLAHDREHFPGPGGVDVVFAPSDKLADEEIVEMVSEASTAVVVVSTDREVREMAEAAGAVAMWGEAFTTWLNRPG